MAGARVHLPAELVAQVDAVRGRASRSGFVRQAVATFLVDPRDCRKPFSHEWLDWFQGLDADVRRGVERALGDANERARMGI